jgi:hypothetical protein
VQINPVHFAAVRNVKTIMNFTLTVHAITALRLPHQLRETLFENASTDSAQNICPCLPLQHHRFNALEVQQL